MLNDSSLKATLGNLDLEVPQTFMVPITVPENSALRPGQLRVRVDVGSVDQRRARPS